MHKQVIRTSLGTFRITASGEAVESLEFVSSAVSPVEKAESAKLKPAVFPPFLKTFRRALENYSRGQKETFEGVPLNLSRYPAFTQQVLKACLRIPFSETRTYRELARDLGKPRAARAVGNALGSNKIPIVIPCHRVVRTDGTLGGYTSGLAWKKQLLNLEKKSGRFVDNAKKRVL